MFRYTQAIDKLLAINKPIKIIQGGTSAGKTEGIIALLIDECCESPDVDLTIVAESVPALKGGALKIFKSTMHDLEYWNDDAFNFTDRIYNFPGGGRAQFTSFDTIGKAKAAGKRTHLFINECQYVPFPIVEELMTRTYKEVWFDYNPNNPFYIQEEVIPRDDAELLILTYEDNEATPDRVKQDFERRKEKAFYNPSGDWNDSKNVKSAYHANWCRVYIRGELGSLEGVIFSNWTTTDQTPKDGLIGYGMDFGFTNDPTTLIACYIVNGVRIFDELIYQRGLTTPDLAKLIQTKTSGYDYIYADSADPKTIAELQSYGIKVRGVIKGPDSINFGISILQEEVFQITQRSVNLIKELREYCWDTDKEGNNTQKPIDVYNHCIDAMRYLSMERLSKSNQPRQRRVTIAKY
ncbi:MAG: terminase large subunit [Bacteroidetes bacterium]|nr:terminase large subunit [Bacteroidota bacterium]